MFRRTRLSFSLLLVALIWCSTAPVAAAAPLTPTANQVDGGGAPQADECANLDNSPFPRPGTAEAAEFWRGFSQPLPPAAVWNPPGPKRVGLQAGHWRVEEAPEELRRLSPGSSAAGWDEWQVNLSVAQRTADFLRLQGIEVDVLSAIIPDRYRAHAFIALHADGDLTGGLRGFKIARANFSAIPEEDDRLVSTLNRVYESVTGIPRDDAHISRRMTGYYAFNSRRYCHALAPGVPGAIVEMGFLTSAVDRQWLIGNPDLLARGIADGVLQFLGLSESA